MRSSCDFKVPPGKYINSYFQLHSEETEVCSGLRAACESVPFHPHYCLWKNPSRDEWQPHMSLPLTTCTAFCSMLSAPPTLPEKQHRNINDKSMTNPAEQSLHLPNVSLPQILQDYYLESKLAVCQTYSSPKSRQEEQNSERANEDMVLTRTEPKSRGLYCFPSLHMPQKQMAFIGHSQLCPDSSYSSFQMALLLGNVKTPVLSVLPPRAVSVERQVPQTQHTFASKPLSLHYMLGK